MKNFWTLIVIIFVFGVSVQNVFAVSSDEYYRAGQSFYSRKDYANAFQYFDAALQVDPKNSSALQGRANCYYTQGQYQDALTDYQNVLVKNPTNIQLSSFIEQIKAKIGSSSGAANTNVFSRKTVKNLESIDDSKAFGVRLESGVGLVSLGDFNTDAKNILKQAKDVKPYDPTYQETATVASVYPDMTIEPTIKLFTFLELGLPISVMPIGDYRIAHSSVNQIDEQDYKVSAFGFGLNGRVFVELNNVTKLFLSAGPVFVPMNLNYTDSGSQSSGSSWNYSANSSNMAIGAQCQLGADYHLGGGILISAYLGYRSASASGFPTTFNGTFGGTYYSFPGQFYVVKNPTYGSFINFIGDQYLSNYSPGSYRPLEVDLSSVLSGVELSMVF